MIFWHESSATEPSGTARDGRADEPGAANIPAMPVAGAAPLVSVPQAGGGQRRGSCDYGADRSALSGPALLWLAPDGGMVGDPRPAGQSGVVLRRDLHPDGQRLSLPGGDHGLGKPRGASLASIEYTRRRFLCRGARGSAFTLWPAGDL